MSSSPEHPCSKNCDLGPLISHREQPNQDQCGYGRTIVFHQRTRPAAGQEDRQQDLPQQFTDRQSKH